MNHIDYHPESLLHYGVKGQKRGVRRYQNEDGTLTEEGKDHYGVGDGYDDHGYYDSYYEERPKKSLGRKILTVGAVAVGAAALGYIAYQNRTSIADAMRNTKAYKRGKNFIENYDFSVYETARSAGEVARTAKAYKDLASSFMNNPQDQYYYPDNNKRPVRHGYLAHYGVKGQKRGKRRYQNEDGSLTQEGKEHYGVGDSPNRTNRQGDKTLAKSSPKQLDRNKKKKAKKIIAIAAGVTLAAVFAYKGVSIANKKGETSHKDPTSTILRNSSNFTKSVSKSDASTKKVMDALKELDSITRKNGK